jgi:hypothetical protein
MTRAYSRPAFIQSWEYRVEEFRILRGKNVLGQCQVVVGCAWIGGHGLIAEEVKNKKYVHNVLNKRSQCMRRVSNIQSRHMEQRSAAFI